MAKHFGIIPKEDIDFRITNEVLNQVARLKITDFETWKRKTRSNKVSLWKVYFRMAALNILKYKHHLGLNKDLRESFIYIIADDKFPNHYKIGRTIEPEKRVIDCNVFSPYKSFRLVSWLYSDEAVLDETVFHEIFREDRTSGEWFYFQNVEIVRSLMEKYLTSIEPPEDIGHYISH